jgi:ABC-type siderophore export system fused ATPase/permease subunit
MTARHSWPAYLTDPARLLLRLNTVSFPHWRSGSSKSTLARLLLGVYEPSGGWSSAGEHFPIITAAT